MRHQAPSRILRTLTVALCLAMHGAASAQGQPRVAVFLSEYGRPHIEVLETLRAELVKEADVVASNDQEPVPANTTVAVAIGLRACDILSRNSANIPVLCSLVPRAGFETITTAVTTRERPKISALYMDIPARRQLAFLHQILPERRRIALLASHASAAEAAHVSTVARELGMSAAWVAVAQDSEIHPALQHLLPDADVLLALPDPSVYNSRTIQNILLTAYRYKVPLVGFSPAYAKAGALLALHTTPAQIGRQTAEMLRPVLGGRGLPQAQYPRFSDVSLNSYVAQSLGINLKDETMLKERLRQLERQP